jgi:hypothetical protein
MDELGATLRRVSKFLGRQRVNASTASISGLENGHLLAGARKLTSGHQARGARTDDQEMDEWSHRLSKTQLCDGRSISA